MAKSTGLGARLFVDGYDLSGDVGSLSRINTARNVNEVPGIDVSAQERRHAHKDGGLEYAAWFNPSAGQAHPVLSAIASTDQHVMYCHRATIGASAAACVCKQLDYGGNRGTDGSYVLNVVAESNGYGLEWGRLLTAGKRSDTGATNGAGVDFTAGTAFGMQAYLQVFSFTGTDASILVQASSDNGVGDAFDEPAGGFTFPQVTSAPFTARLATGSSIERYLRVATVTTGGFSEMTFAVMVVKNAAAVSF
jgi:hypothetical protein